MVTLLFTALFIIGILAISLYLWAPSSRTSEPAILPPSDPPRGLFTDNHGFESALPNASKESSRADERVALSDRARAGDKSALLEIHALGEPEFFNEILSELVANADRAPQLLALVSYVTRNQLPVNKALAKSVVASWKVSPDRGSTATALHLAALADDADLFLSTIETSLNLWRQGSLADVSATELAALFDGEFWVLSAHTRSSGSGFILKRTLVNARRELEAASSLN